MNAMVEKVLVERFVARCPKCGRIIHETLDMKQAENLQRSLDSPTNRCTGRVAVLPGTSIQDTDNADPRI